MLGCILSKSSTIVGWPSLNKGKKVIMVNMFAVMRMNENEFLKEVYERRKDGGKTTCEVDK